MPDSNISAVRSALKRDRQIQAARKLARVVTHQDPDIITQRKTRQLEKSLKNWLRYFGYETFYDPFCKDHLKVIKYIEECINYGGQFALAMPRAQGKTAISRWAVLYAMLTGKREYVVFLAATGEDAQLGIEFAKKQLETNERLHRHYPHVTTYIRATDGTALKARHQLRIDLQPSGLEYPTASITFPSVTTEKQVDKKGDEITRDRATGYPSNGAILIAKGLTGAIRGKNETRADGKTVRPDFVILDDPQTREVAESESQTAMRERIIKGDVLGLAGHDKKIAAVMPCTIIKPGDLAARFLDRNLHPNWRGVITKLVNQFPEAEDTLWQEYAVLWQHDQINGTKTASAFYKKNRKAMDKGASVSWKQRKRPGEISALQTAFNYRLELGDAAFFAEYQNEPKALIETMFTLTPQLVQSREDKTLLPGKIPDWAVYTVASTDVNPSYALTTEMKSFGLDQRSHVPWYGLHSMDVDSTLSDEIRKREIMRHLTEHEEELMSLPCRPGVWIIDGGGSPQETVITFAALSWQRTGIPTYCAFGRGSNNFRVTKRQGRRLKSGEYWHHIAEHRSRQWIIWNSDYWGEQALRGFTSPPGSPGSCSLPQGDHTEYAKQMCNEQLTSKVDAGDKIIWLWNTRGKHDFKDTSAQAYMGASFAFGIGAGTPVPTITTRKIYTLADLKRG